MDALLLALKNYILDHWSFVAAAIVLGFILQWMKLNVCPLERCASSKWRRNMRRVLPLTVMVMGALLGLFTGIPTSVGVTTLSGRVLYFALAGVFASYVFNVIRQFTKNYGVEIPIADDEPPVVTKRDPASDTAKSPSP